MNRFFDAILITLTTSVILSHADSLAETGGFNCVANYLRSKKLINPTEVHSSYRSQEIDISEEECRSNIEEYRKMFYTALKDEFIEDENLEEYADCLVEHLKNTHVAEVSLKRMVYEHSTKISKRKRRKGLKAIDYAIEKKLETAVKICTFEEIFGEVFDVLYFAGKSSGNESGTVEMSDNLQDDYCERKYMVDKNFIDIAVYDVNVNPKNISVSALDCDEIVENSINQAVDELRETFKDELERGTKCVSKVIRTGNYFENNVKIVMLGEIGISDKIKSEERTKYIEEMKELYDNILRC